MLYMSIDFGMEVNIGIHDDFDKTVYRKSILFPKFGDELAEIVMLHGTDDFKMIALHGMPQYTVKVLPVVQKVFPNALVIVDGGKKNDSVSAQD